MKKLLFVLIMFSAISCATHRRAYEVRHAFINYSEYFKNGFYITEAPSVSFEYTPVGSIRVEVLSGYESSVSKKRQTFKNASIYDGLNELHSKCIEVGANGIINLNLNFETIVVETTSTLGKPIESNGIKIILTGMAIKK